MLMKWKSRQKKGFFKQKFLPFLIQAVIVYMAILGIFAFSSLPYLSNATFIFATWPFISFLVFAGFVFLMHRYYPKSNRKNRLIFIALTSLGLLVMATRTAYFTVSEASQRESVTYSQLMSKESQEKLLGTEGQFMAGAAKGDITPTKELFPMPLLSILKFRDINDKVSARVLAMSDGKEKYLYIALDMTLVPRPEETLAFISQETGISQKNILITATHTHGVSPISLMDYSALDNMKLDKWYRQIQNTLIKTIVKAQQNMVPAQYGYGEGLSNINVNRDILDETGKKSILGRNLGGYSDKTIRMVKINDMKGKTIALMVNHATHGVVMNGSISGPSTSLTGDLPGRSATKVEAQLDGGIVLWSSSAAGDQNPKISAQGVLVGENGKRQNYMLGKKASSVVLEHLSDEHAQDILTASKNIEVKQTDSAIQTQVTTVTAEGDKGKRDDKTLRLQVFKLGNIAFQGVSAEVVSSIGQKLFEQSPYEQTIIMTHMNGYEGYLADSWEYDHDAFEQGNSGLKRGASEEALLEGFSELHQKVK